MQKRIRVIALNEEEALAKAAKAFRVAKDYLFAQFLGELQEGNNYEIILDISLALKGSEYLKDIVTFFDPNAKVKSKYSADETNLEFFIDTTETSLLIGKGGKNLSALQVLLKKYLESFTSEKLIISIDIDGYKEQEKALLISLARRIAKEVETTKIPVKLDPMNPYKRHIIHEALQNNKKVKTESEGFGNQRAVVIKPLK